MSPVANEDVLYVDNVDMRDLDLWVKTPSGWADGPLVNRNAAALGGRAGEVVVTREVSMGGRDMTIPAELTCRSPGVYALRLKAIKRLFYAGAYVHLRF